MPNPTHSRALALLLFIATTIALSLPVHASLIFNYKFNEGSGTSVTDSTAASAHGTFNGTGLSWVSDTPSGAGYSLKITNETSNYVSAGVVSKLQGLGDFTISYWMDLSAINTVNDRIFSTRSTDTSLGWLDLLAASTDLSKMKLSLNIKAPGQTSATATSSEFDATGGWVFVAITRDASEGTIKFYIGDTTVTTPLSGAGTIVGTNTSTNINQSSSEFRFGGTASTALNRSPAGNFSDFRIYDEVLGESSLNGIRTGAIPEPSSVAMLLGAAVLAGVIACRSRH